MERSELVRKLEELQAVQKTDPDWSWHHEKADQLLLDYIDDPEVTNAFYNINKWYG